MIKSYFSFLRALISDIRGNRGVSGSAGIYLHSISDGNVLWRTLSKLLTGLEVPSFTIYPTLHTLLINCMCDMYKFFGLVTPYLLRNLLVQLPSLDWCDLHV